jgi:signal peptidase I
MTTTNPNKLTDLDPKPLVNPILQDDIINQDIPEFAKYQNSFEPDVKINTKTGSKAIKQNGAMRVMGFVLTILGNLIVVSVLVVLILKIFVFQQVEVDGLSMYPNFNDKDLLMMNSIDKGFDRGQVVALYAKDDFAQKVAKMNFFDQYMARFDCGNPCNAKFYLKRVIGLPGEQVEVANGDVIIYNKENPNGSVLKEDYIPQTTKDTMKKSNYHFSRVFVPEGKYFVMGDNRTNSTDSRVIGSISNYAIFGKHNFRVGNFTNNNGNALDSFGVFGLPKYDFLEIPEEDKLLMSK